MKNAKKKNQQEARKRLWSRAENLDENPLSACHPRLGRATRRSELSQRKGAQSLLAKHWTAQGSVFFPLTNTATPSEAARSLGKPRTTATTKSSRWHLDNLRPSQKLEQKRLRWPWEGKLTLWIVKNIRGSWIGHTENTKTLVGNTFYSKVAMIPVLSLLKPNTRSVSYQCRPTPGLLFAVLPNLNAFKSITNRDNLS